MENENPVYVRLEYYESLESKRDILSSEKYLLNMLKIIKRYNAIRQSELKIRTQMHKTIKEIDAAVKKTKSSFPFLDIPEMVKREELRKEVDIARGNFDADLEVQLKEIQKRLDSLGSRD